MGLSEHEVVSNIITSLTSDGMISPSYWVDPKSGNLYMLAVQFPDNTVRSLEDLKMMPVRSSDQKNTTNLGNVTDVKLIESPTEVDHYKLRRVIDVYISTKGEELSRVANAVNQVVNHVEKPEKVVIYVRGIVGAMNSSMQSFGLGLILSLALVYLVLVAQFRSFVDPFLILLAVRCSSFRRPSIWCIGNATEVVLDELIGQRLPIDLPPLAKNDARWINAFFAITNGLGTRIRFWILVLVLVVVLVLEVLLSLWNQDRAKC